MNVTREDLDPVSLRLTVKIDENDYKDDVTKQIKEIGRTHVIPGFRKGHVPFGELKRRFGKQSRCGVYLRKQAPRDGSSRSRRSKGSA